MEQLTNRQRKKRRNWKTAHGVKRVFPSRRAAALEILRLWKDNREVNLSMSWYWCKWGPHWQKGLSYPPHLHIGHDRVHSRRRRFKRELHRLTIWPFRRVWWYLLTFRTKLRNYISYGVWRQHRDGNA